MRTNRQYNTLNVGPNMEMQDFYLGWDFPPRLCDGIRDDLRHASSVKSPVEWPDRGTLSSYLEDTENLPLNESNISTVSKMWDADSDMRPPATAKL